MALSVDSDGPVPMTKAGKAPEMINHWRESFSFQSNFGQRHQAGAARAAEGAEPGTWVLGASQLRSEALERSGLCAIEPGTCSLSGEPSLFLSHPPRLRTNREGSHVLKLSLFLYCGWSDTEVWKTKCITVQHLNGRK